VKKNNISYLILIGLSVCFLMACGSRKDVVYFQDMNNISEVVRQNDNAQYELKIHPNDNLYIMVSALNPEAAEIFNGSVSRVQTMGNTSVELRGYLVDETGDINFPVIGRLPLAGLTKQEANELIQKEVSKYIENPVVNIRYLNYKIYILGEVTSPGSYTIGDEKISVPQAIALAHDMTILGDRHNVMIYRVENGEKKVFRLDLTSADVFFSENYYLQQNDIVYVYPNGTKIRTAKTYSPIISVIASSISLLFSFYAIFRLRKL
jgi:polysaccharide export outer membrane protein